jgi:hypothetical protein
MIKTAIITTTLALTLSGCKAFPSNQDVQDKCVAMMTEDIMNDTENSSAVLGLVMIPSFCEAGLAKVRNDGLSNREIIAKMEELAINE